MSVIPRVQAIFVIATSTLILRTGALRRWVAFLGYIAGLALLVVPILTRPAGFGFPLWVAVLSLALLIREERAGHLRAPPS